MSILSSRDNAGKRGGQILASPRENPLFPPPNRCMALLYNAFLVVARNIFFVATPEPLGKYGDESLKNKDERESVKGQDEAKEL